MNTEILNFCGASMSIADWVGVGGFAIAAFLLVMKIRDRFFLKTKVFGKIISLNSSPNADFSYGYTDSKCIENRKLAGMLTLIKLNLFVKDKDLNFKDIKVKVKYPDDEKECDAEIVYSSKGFGFQPLGTFKAPHESFLHLNSYLSVGKSHNYYLGFFIAAKEKSEDVRKSVFEYIKISFINANDGEVNLNTLYFKDFDQKKGLFEEEFWHK
jgi:hypothetical protein